MAEPQAPRNNFDSAGGKSSGGGIKRVARAGLVGLTLVGGAGDSVNLGGPQSQPDSGQSRNEIRSQAPDNPYKVGAPIAARPGSSDALDDQANQNNKQQGNNSVGQQNKPGSGGLPGSLAGAAGGAGTGAIGAGAAQSGGGLANQLAGSAANAGQQGAKDGLTKEVLDNLGQDPVSQAKNEQFWIWYATVIPSFGLTLLYLHGWAIVGHYVKRLALTRVQIIVLVLTDLLLLAIICAILVLIVFAFCNALPGWLERIYGATIGLVSGYKSVCKPFQPF